MNKSITVIVPVFNEEETLDKLIDRIYSTGDDHTLIQTVLVDDGSNDGSWVKMMEISSKNPNITSVRLSRNFGHQFAVLAGIDYARRIKSDYMAIIDADLQDPPELIPVMANMLNPNVDVVYGKRIHRDGESLLKKLTAKLFYRLFDWLVPFSMPLDVGDFRVFKSELAKTILESRDSSPFLRGLFAHAGFTSISLPYSRQKRFAGSSKYSYGKMLKLAFDAILGFSDKPFRILLKYSVLSLFVVLLIAIYSLINAFIYGSNPGWMSMFALVSFFGTLNVLLLSLIGRYVTISLTTTVSRPRWIVREIISSS